MIKNALSINNNKHKRIKPNNNCEKIETNRKR